jgi:hypothetical protein
VATNKKAISAYLPTGLEECLTKYCTEYDITRKDKSGEIKPALGTAVVEILKIFFSSENIKSPLPDNVPLLPSNVVTEDRLSEVLSELKSSGKVTSSLPSNVLTEDDLDKQVEAATLRAIRRLGESLIAELKSDEEFLRAIALEVQKISAMTTDHENYTSENELEQVETEINAIASQIDKASLAPIFEEVEESEPEKLLSAKAALAIAKQRGYKSGKKASLCSD